MTTDYMTVITTPNFWDCECEKNHIRRKAVPECPVCNACEEDQPDSRLSEVITEAAQHYVDLKHRRRHPVGKFDQGGRWYPAQEHTCCAGIRGPSRTYPFSLLTHCRSAQHVAAEYGVEKAALMTAAKAIKEGVDVRRWARFAALGRDPYYDREI